MKNKAILAAFGAITTYIKEEEEYKSSLLSQKLPENLEQKIEETIQIESVSNIWGLSGRQVQMNANSMMQLRMFK